MRKGTKPLREGSKLDLEIILEAAFAVLDTYGLDGLNLIAVADKLEVKSPALYWHVKNKAELIGIMSATIMRTAMQVDEDENLHWRDKLLISGRRLRRALLQHPDATRLCLAAKPITNPDAAAMKLAKPLIASGLDARQALSFQSAVISFTVGSAAFEQSPSFHDFLTHMIDFDESFETGLQAMVCGFQACTECNSPTCQVAQAMRASQ